MQREIARTILLMSTGSKRAVALADPHRRLSTFFLRAGGCSCCVSCEGVHHQMYSAWAIKKSGDKPTGLKSFVEKIETSSLYTCPLGKLSGHNPLMTMDDCPGLSSRLPTDCRLTVLVPL